MEIDKLSNLLPLIQGNVSCSLTLSERVCLNSSLLILKKNGKFHKVQFWGKIYGLQKDYLIAQGIGKNLNNFQRKSFYSQDGVNWMQLPELDKEKLELASKINTRFTGDASKKSKVWRKPKPVPYSWSDKKKKSESTENEESGEGDGGENEEDDDGENEDEGDENEGNGVDDKEGNENENENDNDEGEDGGENENENEDGGNEKTEKNKKKKKKRQRFFFLNEEQRLSAVIKNIDESAVIVPKGSYKLAPNQDILQNSSFTGIATDKVDKLSSYLHLRQAERIKNRKLIDYELEGLNKATDFLDAANEDIPIGVWSVAYDPVMKVASLNNLIWPGFVAFHIAETPLFGYGYFGTGVRNDDAGFGLSQ